MRTDDFWTVVDRAAVGADGEPQLIAERITADLAARPVAEIVGFDRHRHRVLAASYQVDLWAAAYLINGGASDDGFEYFRCWLMTRGRSAFARAVQEPDTLAELPEIRRAAATGEDFECEEMLHVAAAAYRRVTGAELPADQDRPRYPEIGEFWDFDDEDEARRRLPRLAELFLEPPDH